jgi:curved DNA-binding protein CbpA
MIKLMERIHTHYDNLKVTRNAPLEVIKAAYRAMAQKYHPDVNSVQGTEHVMKLINEAWVVLSDPIKRAEHDEWIKNQEMNFLVKKTPQPPTNSAHGKDYFSDASEGYKAATPYWRRVINSKLISFYKRSKQPRSVILARFGILIILGSLIFGVVFLNNNSAVENQDKTKLANTQNTADETKSISIQNKEWWNDAPLAEASDVKSTANSNGKIAEDFSNPGTLTPNAQRLNNGYLKGEKQSFSSGLSTFKIDNTNGSHDAEVRLYLGGKQIRSMFVRVGTAFTAEKLAAGTYKMRYKMRIDNQDRAFQAKDDFVLTQTRNETENGISTRFSRMTVTLYKVKDGNLQTEEIPVASF